MVLSAMHGRMLSTAPLLSSITEGNSNTARRSAAVLIYSWQPLRHITGGSDGARHAGMTQRLIQVVRTACRLGLEPFFLSGQPVAHGGSAGSSSRRHGTVSVGGCRVRHYYGSTAAQHAQLSAEGTRPLFAFIFYTAAWFAIEQRAIRNTTGWALPELYLDEEASAEGGLGLKERRLLQLLRTEHPYASIAVVTDDIQSEKLGHVLPAARRGEGDGARVAHVVKWMERREVSVYSASDAVVTVSAHDASWIRRRLRSQQQPTRQPTQQLAQQPTQQPTQQQPQQQPQQPQQQRIMAVTLPFVAYPPPPRAVAGFASRAGMVYCGVAHTSAAQSLRWFLSSVLPLLVKLLRRHAATPDEAAAHSQLQVIGWGLEGPCASVPAARQQRRARPRLPMRWSRRGRSCGARPRVARRFGREQSQRRWPRWRRRQRR